MQVTEIITEIRKFNICQCQMSHEVVLTDLKTGLPIKSEILGIEYQRVNMCPIEKRSAHLGCAHSMSQAHFNSLMKGISLTNKHIKGIMDDCNQIFLDIYKLDHEMGYLELDIASEKEKNGHNFISEELLSKKNEFIKKHRQYMDNLKQLIRNLILAMENLS